MGTQHFQPSRTQRRELANMPAPTSAYREGVNDLPDVAWIVPKIIDASEKVIGTFGQELVSPRHIKSAESLNVKVLVPGTDEYGQNTRKRTAVVFGPLPFRTDDEDKCPPLRDGYLKSKDIVRILNQLPSKGIEFAIVAVSKEQIDEERKLFRKQREQLEELEQQGVVAQAAPRVSHLDPKAPVFETEGQFMRAPGIEIEADDDIPEN